MGRFGWRVDYARDVEYVEWMAAQLHGA